MVQKAKALQALVERIMACFAVGRSVTRVVVAGPNASPGRAPTHMRSMHANTLVQSLKVAAPYVV